MEPPEKFKEYFARGDVTEDEVKADLRSQGYVISREQEEVVMDITDEIKVVGHIDGVRSDYASSVPTQHKVLEVKRMADAYWQTVKRFGLHNTPGLVEKYLWQMSAYMHATGLEGVFVFRNGDTGEDLIFDLETPPYERNAVVARVLVVEGRARSFGTLDDLQACDSKDYPCPFYYTHLEDDREELDGDEAELLVGVALTYTDAKRREQEAKDEAKRAREELVSILGERNRVSAGRVRVTTFTQQRKRFDRKRAESDGLDLSKYDTTQPVDNIRVTVREDGIDVDQ